MAVNPETRDVVNRLMRDLNNQPLDDWEPEPGVVMKVDIAAPWWEVVGRYPSYDSHFSALGWAGMGMRIQALHGGPVVRQFEATGSFLEGDTVTAFLDKFAKAFPDLVLVDEDIQASNNKIPSEFSYVSPRVGMYLNYDGDATVSFSSVSNDSDFTGRAEAFMKAQTTKSVPKGRVHVLITTQQGPEFKSMGVGGQPLERGNYSPEVLEGFDRIVEDLQSKVPAGRVAILDGSPGTGKTFLVRGLLDAVHDVIFVIVPANLVTELAQPGMIPALVELHQSRGEKAMVFLIEDADEVLLPRGGDNMSAVSTVLNLGDGILGQLLDVRIVATTNALHTDVDEAIKRPGRLSAMVHVGKLSADRACEVYTRLTGKPALVFDESSDLLQGQSMFRVPTSVAEVYSIARDTGWKPAPKASRRVGFGVSEDDE